MSYYKESTVFNKKLMMLNFPECMWIIYVVHLNEANHYANLGVKARSNINGSFWPYRVGHLYYCHRYNLLSMLNDICSLKERVTTFAAALVTNFFI